MRVTRFVESKRVELVSLTCDKCKRVYPVADDDFEIQEFHHIHFTGGYGSDFGDTVEVRCDICQHCLYEMIKDFMVTAFVNTSSNM